MNDKWWWIKNLSLQYELLFSRRLQLTSMWSWSTSSCILCNCALSFLLRLSDNNLSDLNFAIDWDAVLTSLLRDVRSVVSFTLASCNSRTVACSDVTSACRVLFLSDWRETCARRSSHSLRKAGLSTSTCFSRNTTFIYKNETKYQMARKINIRRIRSGDARQVIELGGRSTRDGVSGFVVRVVGCCCWDDALVVHVRPSHSATLPRPSPSPSPKLPIAPPTPPCLPSASTTNVMVRDVRKVKWRNHDVTPRYLRVSIGTFRRERGKISKASY